MEVYFLELGIVLILSSIIGIFFRAIKQPLILAYIATGLLLGPLFLKVVVSGDLVNTFSSIGVTFLLFLVGIELDLRKLKHIGKATFIAAIGHFFVSVIVGFLISYAFGISLIASMYIGLALTFSSTVIVVKLLEQSHDNNSLYGKISVGFLIIQDIIAIITLVFLDALKLGQNISVLPVILLFLKAILLIAAVFTISSYILPHVFRYVGKSQELLFVLAISWSFLISIIAFSLGLNIEMGAFIAGLSLAYLPYVLEITSRVKSLRDFFLILFFVALGTQISFASSVNIGLIIALTLSVLIIQPIVIMIILGILGYSKRTSFLTAISVAQVSEFSLVIISIGLVLGHINQDIISIILIIAVLTITVSTYYIKYGGKIFHVLRNYLSIFERKELKEHTIPLELKIKDHVVVVGHHVMGSRITSKLISMKKKVLVVDFDPEVVTNLTCIPNVTCLYGDVEDAEVFEMLHLEKASMLVSTIPDIKTNLFLIKAAKKANPKIVVMVATGHTHEAFDLYGAGADYVILPYVLGGEHSSLLIQKIDENPEHIKVLKEEHLKELRKKATLYSFF
ncbi:sodium:proton exchanger [bacterium]|nr:sodium:proton exchanger [bacterium]